MELEQLKQEVESLRAALAEVKRSVSDEPKVEKEVETKTSAIRPIYIAPGRRLDTFQGRPAHPSDQTAHDWVAGVRAQLELRGMVGKEAAAFIREHLVGDARREVNGRGAEVTEDPEKIFNVLVRVFGDGNALPQLQQQFYSYQQGHAQDLLRCSLQLVEIYDRMVALDKSQEAHPESALKNRFAEAVRDESLKRELRRLNIDQPGLKFFDLRDRAIQWLGPSSQRPKEATVKTIATDQGVLELIQKQMENQQKQLDQLQSLLVNRRNVSPGGFRCYHCNEKGHIRRNCPKLKGQEGSNNAHQNQTTGQHLNE